jgi:hypothetical protein
VNDKKITGEHRIFVGEKGRRLRAEGRQEKN